MNTLKKNDRYTVTIDGYNSEAQGVCRVDGRAVIVPRALPGEVWEIKILKVTNSAVFAKGEKLLSPSPCRMEPECAWFGKCGGCVIEPKFDRIYDFSEGVACVEIDGKWGYVNKEGRFAIEPKFNWVYNFSEGLAKIKIDCKWGYIDREGRFFIEPKFDEAYDFSDGLACIELDGKWGYIDREGRIVIEPKFDSIGIFSEGLAGVKIDGKWGYIDREGRIVIEPKFDSIGNFSEGVAMVKVDGKWGYIDKDERFVIEPKFDRISDFFDGLVAVKVDGKTSVIDKEGQFVFAIDPKFDWFSSFSEGTAYVKVEGKSGIINEKGQWVVEPKFNNIHRLPGGKFIGTTARLKEKTVKTHRVHLELTRTANLLIAGLMDKSYENMEDACKEIAGNSEFDKTDIESHIMKNARTIMSAHSSKGDRLFHAYATMDGEEVLNDKVKIRKWEKLNSQAEKCGGIIASQISDKVDMAIFDILFDRCSHQLPPFLKDYAENRGLFMSTGNLDTREQNVLFVEKLAEDVRLSYDFDIEGDFDVKKLRLHASCPLCYYSDDTDTYTYLLDCIAYDNLLVASSGINKGAEIVLSWGIGSLDCGFLITDGDDDDDDDDDYNYDDDANDF